MVYCSSSLVSKIYQIYHRSSSFPSQYTSGGSRGRVGGPAPQHPSLIFWPKWGPKGWKNFFWRLTPPPPPIHHCNILYLPNLVSGQVGYEELAGGFKPIRNGKIFWMNNSYHCYLSFTLSAGNTEGSSSCNNSKCPGGNSKHNQTGFYLHWWGLWFLFWQCCPPSNYYWTIFRSCY